MLATHDVFLTTELKTDLVLMKTPRMKTLVLSSFERNERFVNKAAPTFRTKEASN